MNFQEDEGRCKGAFACQRGAVAGSWGDHVKGFLEFHLLTVLSVLTEMIEEAILDLIDELLARNSRNAGRRLSATLEYFRFSIAIEGRRNCCGHVHFSVIQEVQVAGRTSTEISAFKTEVRNFVRVLEENFDIAQKRFLSKFQMLRCLISIGYAHMSWCQAILYIAPALETRKLLAR